MSDDWTAGEITAAVIAGVALLVLFVVIYKMYKRRKFVTTRPISDQGFDSSPEYSFSYSGKKSKDY